MHRLLVHTSKMVFDEDITKDYAAELGFTLKSMQLDAAIAMLWRHDVLITARTGFGKVYYTSWHQLFMTDMICAVGLPNNPMDLPAYCVPSSIHD